MSKISDAGRPWQRLSTNTRETYVRLASVNVGLPRDVIWHARTVTTAIYKQPVEGRLTLRQLNLDGDRQADLTVRGGIDKAVYCYPIEHYAYWKRELPGCELPTAIFGENFATEGLLEDFSISVTVSPSVLLNWWSHSLAFLAPN